MRRCPKCDSHFGDDAKICRTCGAILEIAAEELPQAVEADPLPPEEEEDAEEATPASRQPWICPQCKQDVPGSFEVCWNCGTSEDGTADPHFSKDAESEDESHAAWQPPDLAADVPDVSNGRVCMRCGSAKIIPDARMHNEGVSGAPQLVVDANPGALIFKDRLFGQIVADICGDCGHVELRAVDPERLYEHYRRLRQ
jgi:ribosomal protein L40E